MKITKRQLKQLIEEELAGLYEDEPELGDKPAGLGGVDAVGGELAGDVGADEAALPAEDDGGSLDVPTMVRSIDRKLNVLMQHFDVEEAGMDAEGPLGSETGMA
tara:strand:- start:235 stop:546 length:312 start_codon:yes stop_codon:yes gene_type:complete